MSNENIKVTIEVYFDEKENLIIEGYDIGKTVEEFWGDSDYEYSSTTSKEESNKLYSLFHLPQDSKQELLTVLQHNYNTNTCYSDLQNLLDGNNIHYQGFSWS